MANIITKIESARGCGYRKGGGLYLISGELSEPCSKLPIPLDVCPTCHSGIKFARSWTWLDGDVIAKPEEHGSGSHNRRCPIGYDEAHVLTFPSEYDMAEHVRMGHSIEERNLAPIGKVVYQHREVHKLGRVGLLWIGERFYQSPSDFTAEASRVGISRRIPAIPRDFEPGKTWVFIAHRKVTKLGHDYVGEVNDQPVPDNLCAYIGPKTWGHQHENPPEEPCDLQESDHYQKAIFSMFRPTHVEYVVKGDETEEELDKVEKRGIVLVKVIRDIDPPPGEETDAERQQPTDEDEVNDDDGGQADAAEQMFLDGEGTLSGNRYPPEP